MHLLGEVAKHHANVWPEFTIHHDGSGRLVVLKESGMKLTHLLLLDFTPMPYEDVQAHVTYNFNLYRTQLQLMERRLFDVYRILKQTNPSLLLLLNNYLK